MPFPFNLTASRYYYPALVLHTAARGTPPCPQCGHRLEDSKVSTHEPLCFAFYCTACGFMFLPLDGMIGRS